jgi:hypothetical protein
MSDEPLSNEKVFWVQVREPTNAARVVTIAEDTEVGRDCDDGVLIDDAAVSRRHLRLEPTEAGLVVVDLGSANGTTVDGERISEPRILHPGSKVHLGETEMMIYEGHRGEAGAQRSGQPIDLSERVSASARKLHTRDKTRGFTGRPPADPR